MLVIQLCAIGVVGALLGAQIFALIKKFGRRDIAHYFLVPIFLYCIGFSMRLTANKPLVDLGYFFTDVTFLIVYTTFSVALLLGQLKYWKR